MQLLRRRIDPRGRCEYFAAEQLSIDAIRVIDPKERKGDASSKQTQHHHRYSPRAKYPSQDPSEPTRRRRLICGHTPRLQPTSWRFFRAHASTLRVLHFLLDDYFDGVVSELNEKPIKFYRLSDKYVQIIKFADRCSCSIISPFKTKCASGRV